jgi:hypothetical protein
VAPAPAALLPLVVPLPAPAELVEPPAAGCSSFFCSVEEEAAAEDEGEELGGVAVPDPATEPEAEPDGAVEVEPPDGAVELAPDEAPEPG